MNGKPVFNVPAKAVLNLKSGFQHKLLCDGMTFTAGSACAYSCSFCYVPSMMLKNPHWQKVQTENPGKDFEDVVIRRQGALEALRSALIGRKGPRYMGDDQAGKVIYASPLVDVAANMELVKETVEMCVLILRMTRWDIRLLSKSTFLPIIAEKLAEQVPDARERVIYGVSTGTLEDGITKAFEQGTPLVSKRIASLHKLQDAGYRTFGMLCPSLPDPQNFYVPMAEAMAKAIRVDRCEHVWAEVINVRGESMTRTRDLLKAGGFPEIAQALERVSGDAAAWETYSRATFSAHAMLYPPGKLRFLQYVNNSNREWWENRQDMGAVLL